MTVKDKSSLSRGKFLQLCTRIALGLAGVLGLGGLVRFFSHAPESGPPSTYQLGPEAEFPPSGSLVRLDIPAVIYRTEEGYQAFSLICTHLGCTLEECSEGFCCPCHGSSFSTEGKVLQGPASADLLALDIELTESGNLLVHVPRGQL